MKFIQKTSKDYQVNLETAVVKYNDDTIKKPKDEPTDLDQTESPNYRQLNNSFHHFRYVIVLLTGVGVGLMFLARLNISVAILSMVNRTALSLAEHPDKTYDELFSPDYVETGEFFWSNEIQQTILSGYMIAYTIPQVLTSKLTLYYGVRISFPVAMMISAVSSALIPIVSYWGWEWVLAMRLINGIGASPIIPTTIHVVEKWMPVSDSAHGIAVLQMTDILIYITAPYTSGLLASIHWKWAFYVPAMEIVVFCLIWLILYREGPEDFPLMSQREYDLVTAGKNVGEQPGKNLPWYFMVKVKSVYYFMTIWFLYCATCTGFLFLFPAYLRKALHVTVEENGFYNFVIQIGNLATAIWVNPLVNFFRNRFNASLTVARRIVIFYFITMAISAWLYIAIFHQDQLIAASINRAFHTMNEVMIVAVIMSQFSHTGQSSAVYSYINTFGNLGSVFFCWASGRLLDATGESYWGWSMVFIAMSIMNVIIFILYCFIDSEPAKIKMSKDIDEKEDGKVSTISP